MADPFEFAEGMVTQLLTLATGSIGGIIALFDDENSPGVQIAGSNWLFGAIGLLALSVVAGIVTLGCLTGELAKKNVVPNANSPGVRYPAMVQTLAFGIGVIAVAAEVVL